MLDTTWGRWTIAVIAAVAIVALLAWARNEPGVGGRVPDPETAVTPVTLVAVAVGDREGPARVD